MGTSEVAHQEIDAQIYPNPTGDVLYVKEMEVKTATVFGMDGRLIPVKTTKNVIDTRQLKAGVYLIKLEDKSGNVVTKRFIKK